MPNISEHIYRLSIAIESKKGDGFLEAVKSSVRSEGLLLGLANLKESLDYLSGLCILHIESELKSNGIPSRVIETSDNIISRTGLEWFTATRHMEFEKYLYVHIDGERHCLGDVSEYCEILGEERLVAYTVVTYKGYGADCKRKRTIVILSKDMRIEP